MERLPVCECESVHQDIVDAVQPQLLDDAEAINLASLFKLFGDGTRVRILQALHECNWAVAKAARHLGISRATLHRRMKEYELAGIETIATIPSREVLLSRLLGSLQSPIANLARVLNQVAEKQAEA